MWVVLGVICIIAIKAIRWNHVARRIEDMFKST